jgi:hypothetical protein
VCPTEAHKVLVSSPLLNLDEMERRLWDALGERRSVDELSHQTQLALGKLSRHRMTLEKNRHAVA